MSSHLLDDSTIMRSIHRKHIQRCVEYSALLVFHGYALWMFIRLETTSILLFTAILVLMGLGAQLAVLRERRRLRHPLDRRRLVVESTESLSGMLLLVLSIIVALHAQIALVLLMQWLSGLLLGYFGGTLVGEYVWRFRTIARLQQYSLSRYEENLTRSVMFPYNLKFIARLWIKS